MTKEERAIKVLINVQSQFQASLDEVDVDEDCKEAEEDNAEIVNALEMAIKALKQGAPIDKSAMMIEIYMKGVNMSGEYQGCWVRFRDIEKIVDKYITENEEGVKI